MNVLTFKKIIIALSIGIFFAGVGFVSAQSVNPIGGNPHPSASLSVNQFFPGGEAYPALNTGPEHQAKEDGGFTAENLGAQDFVMSEMMAARDFVTATQFCLKDYSTSSAPAYLFGKTGLLNTLLSESTAGLDCINASTGWPTGGLPAGSTTQTLRYNNGQWEANSALRILEQDNGVAINVAGGPSYGQQLDVNGRIEIAGGNPVPGRALHSIDSQGNAEWRDLPTPATPPANPFMNRLVVSATGSDANTSYRYVQCPATHILIGGGARCSSDGNAEKGILRASRPSKPPSGAGIEGWYGHCDVGGIAGRTRVRVWAVCVPRNGANQIATQFPIGI